MPVAMPSTTVVNTIGSLGGGVLSACLIPQLWRLYRTRSAGDLAYLYLLAYCSGLFLTFLYLYWEGATVAWVCILIEIGCALLVLGAKVYLDHCGPHSKRAKAAAAAALAAAVAAEDGTPARSQSGLDATEQAIGTGVELSPQRGQHLRGAGSHAGTAARRGDGLAGMTGSIP